MAIQLSDASELMMSLALFVASSAMVRYTRRRVKELPEEDKRMSRPLYAYAAGTFAMGLASLTNFLSAVMLTSGSLELRLQLAYTYAAFALLAPLFITAAALIVLGRGQFIVPALAAMAIVSVFWILRFAGVPLDIRDSTGDVTSAMYLPVVILFAYTFARTRRPTSLALFYLVTAYPLYRLTIHPFVFGALNLADAVIGLRLLGPAIAAVAFYYKDIGISVELALYGVSYALLSFFLSYFIGQPLPDLVQETSITLVVIAAVLGWSTSGYTYARWKKTRSRATLALFMFLFLSVASYVLDVTQTIGVSSSITWYYAAVYLSVFSLMFFNLSAFFALDWRALALLPALIIMPEVIYVSMSYPQDMTTMPYTVPILAVTGIVQFVLPLIVYLYLWRRMSKAMQPSAGRPLLIAIGAISMLLAMAPASGIANPIASVLILAAYLCWWLGVTGKLESFTKWYFASTAKEKAPLGRL